ncbi:MAG: ComF family protein [Alistipes sp.]|nr:ComF family protein [Alistipes sp.]
MPAVHVLLTKLLRFAADLIYPVRCPVCGEFISREEGFCGGCRSRLTVWKDSFSLADADDFFAAYEYNNEIKPAVVLMKQGVCGNAPYAFGKALGELIRPVIPMIKPDMIIPVPMHKSDRRRRGCNQAELVAKELGRELDIPVRSDIVVKTRKTAEQKDLNRQEREINLRDAFTVIDGDIIRGRNIILLDDVCTTGSTLREVSRVLKISGAGRISCACCCKTPENYSVRGEV